MKRLWILTVFMMMVMAVTAAAGEEDTVTSENTQTKITAGGFSEHGKLSVKGTDLVGEAGEKVRLCGVSTHGIAWYPQYVNEDSFRTLKEDWGANLIRLAMYTAEYGGYCTDGNQEDLESLIDTGVQAAAACDMYCIIDWHILSDGDPNTCKSQALDFFSRMSEKYKDYGNVLYEICNEPNGGVSWAGVKSYAEEVIPVIRANTPDALILVGSPTWSQDVDLAAQDPITGYENILYTLHFYAATHKDDLRNKFRTAHDAGLPIIVSEFSICDASGAGEIDYDSAAAWRNLFDEYGLSFAGWSLSNKDETSALLKADASSVSGWSEEELSDTGKWLKETIAAFTAD